MKLLAENLIRFKAKNLSDSQKNRLLSEQLTIGNTTVTKQIEGKNKKLYYFAPTATGYDLIVTDDNELSPNIDTIHRDIPFLEDLGFDYVRNKATGRRKLDDTDSLTPNADAQYGHDLLTNVIGISRAIDPNKPMSLDDIKIGYPVLYVAKVDNNLIPVWGMMTVRKDPIDMHPGVKRQTDPHIEDDSELEDEPETPKTIAISGRRGVIQIDQYLPSKDKEKGWFLHVFPPADERHQIIPIES